MGRTERLLKLANLLRGSRKLRFDQLLERLEVSRATLKRDLKYLREQLGTPIEYDTFERSYQVGGSRKHTPQELPGLWVSESDLRSLLLAQRLLGEVDPSGGLAPDLGAFIRRVESMLAQGEGSHEWAGRIVFSSPGRRAVAAPVLNAVTTALMQRRRMRLGYFTRSRQAETLRDVSPQRLVYQRTWYLDAWCHHAAGLRRFALDAVGTAALLEEAAVVISVNELERLLDGGYGAFAGEPNQWAVLAFSPEVAQWVGRELWHPMQRVRRLEDGRLELMLPYDKPTELLMDVLRYGAQVEVIGNPALRAAVVEAAEAVLHVYKRDS
jgi:predicted DNA-binding transcriptional regulator YafY